MQHDHFGRRHIGPNATDSQAMLDTLGIATIDELVSKTVPANILKNGSMELDAGLTEQEALAEIKGIADKNQVFTSLIGMGYYDTITPAVILRNVLENPGWYTAYTPYQPEIAQGRLEALLNYQQMVMDLTSMDIANASLLDEATAAAEAMSMCKRHLRKNKSNIYFVDADCHPQTIAVVQTRAEHFGWDVVTGNPETDLEDLELFGALLQYPTSSGKIIDLTEVIATVHAKGALATVAGDLMSMVLLKPAGEMGADIVVGNNQRFGVPMGFGGPHAGFFAFRDNFKRSAPGRIIGVSIDTHGKPALRMAMQTREQHIRREKANSNICTAQALLAIISSFYAAYHGPEGLKAIAGQIHNLTSTLAAGVQNIGFTLRHDTWFDTITVDVGDQQAAIIAKAESQRINLRKIGVDAIGISLDETSTEGLLEDILAAFGASNEQTELSENAVSGIPAELVRSSDFLTHEIFSKYHSETEMMRYMHRLESKDIALNLSMIALGSCTMKLNAAAEMIPITWSEFSDMHPFAPITQAAGYTQLFEELEQMLVHCTGYDAVSLQPNAGSQGEYAGLVAIKKYHQSRGDHHRNICLIPSSAHGTNPASAQMVGMKVVVTKCDENGNVDMTDLQDKCEKHRDNLAAIMITYPSTHGVFEENVTSICALIHQHGGQVYVDGANMNAQVGLAAPGQYGGDVSHLNLHKTFCIPHGGGGPGVGPIGVGEHLKPFLPGHNVQPIPGTDAANGVISAAPWGSASILPISWMYVRMMGAEGMRKATETAILNANYLANQLAGHYPVLYTGANGFIAHECIIDIRPLKEASGISEEDIAKRLMDFGFHAPTMSFPVAGTLMIEPTESESKDEIDRFVEAMITIRQEIAKVQNGDWTLEDNPLVNAPHTMDDVLTGDWNRAYSREVASRPANWLKEHKFWPSVNRIDNVYGDRNLICSCPSIENYVDA